ncbi:hypothetical protein H311_02758 [Anncaliia algerae PRA109]|nr:hypothetical protein H311_02758 [Anncaliia algerae PRA109]
MRHLILIGGSGHEIETDECQLVRRNYGIGHIVRSCWVLGAYDVETYKCFFFIIDDKWEDTLLPLILQHVREGSTIYTDCHPSYNNLQLYGYQHVLLITVVILLIQYQEICKNHIESIWENLKGKSKERYGTHRTTLDLHIYGFIWRRKYGRSFSKFISHVAEEYNLN